MGDPEPAKRERKFALSSLTAKIGAVGATIATLVGLLFVFVPSLQPTVRHCGETASGDISQIRVEQGTFADYLSLSDRPTKENIDGNLVPYRKSDLRRRGNILLYDASDKLAHKRLVESGRSPAFTGAAPGS